ncbi:hypothetical protein EFK50_03335 [Nocardioides marmoriginsengisoli]|uniref:Uncharacterized protein n=1 Tax=Nocardioides marmoriginsengisoli TaxID=661483 RepID=A0A3N0CNZ3_9ACTN|nr:hypothetical protein [Nocardioides marmoriginsengisoli]RNL65021.1 hypothetical protein EFK50_03335 [Nocardioides marmoriginsengisoli]
MRGIFFDEDAAREVERQLAADGFEVTVTREPFAGEDDDEDHPWSVATDAPPVVLELLIDKYDGWLDDDIIPTAPILPPTPLPEAPRRRHRPGDDGS